MARYVGGSREAELPKLELAIVRSELTVCDLYWKRRARRWLRCTDGGY